MAKKLVALSEYHAPSRGLHYQAGQELEADDALYLFLMADAPGSFAEAKAIEVPPADKMLRSPKAKK